MSAQHTPGPWYPAAVSTAVGQHYVAQRVVCREPRAHEYLRDETGKPQSFKSEADARAAIAKATGRTA